MEKQSIRVRIEKAIIDGLEKLRPCVSFRDSDKPKVYQVLAQFFGEAAVLIGVFIGAERWIQGATKTPSEIAITILSVVALIFLSVRYTIKAGTPPA